MNDQTEILDAPAQTEAPASSAEISVSLDRVKGEVAAFDKIAAGLSKLRKQHPSDLVVDVTTPAGMKVAIAARAAWRDPRVALERARKSAKAPVLDLGRSIDKFAASIEEQLRIGESNYHDQIKVEEERKAREKKAAEEAEAQRVQQIQGKIAFLFTTRTMRMANAGPVAIKLAIDEVEEAEISEAVYAEFSQEAVAAKDNAAAELRRLWTAKKEAEAEADRVRTQAEENRRKQEELAKREADFEESQRAMRERIQAEANERQAKEDADRAARKAEQDKIDADRAALARERQAEEDRKAAIERKRLDDEAQAERDRLAAEHRAEREREREAEAERMRVLSAENAERERVAQEAQAKADAERIKKEKAQAAALKKAQKMAGMAPRLLEALKDLEYIAATGKDCSGSQELTHARKVIAEAEAE